MAGHPCSLLPPGARQPAPPAGWQNTPLCPSTSAALAEQRLRLQGHAEAATPAICTRNVPLRWEPGHGCPISLAQEFGPKEQCFLSCTGQLDLAVVKKLRCAIKTRQAEFLQGQEESAEELGSLGKRDLQGTTMVCHRSLTSKHK